MERRLTAILAADVVGYSRLIRADEEGTLAAFNALRAELIDPKIADHHGRVFKLMGDGMLAEFASVVDAVRAAAEVQQAVAIRNADIPQEKRIEFRVGINLGDIVIDGDDIHGDGVNVAARLEGLAEPGGIYVSAAVYDQVRDRIDFPFEDLGEQNLKNIDRPVRVFRIATGTVGVVEARRLHPSRRRLQVAITVLALLLVAGGAAWSIKPWDPVPVPPDHDVSPFDRLGKPSIAVLPFNNLSSDPAEDYFSDGLTEDIINSLGRYQGLAVMAFNAGLQYRGGATKSQEIGLVLGVRYLVEGSVQRTGDKIRFSTRLTDAQRGLLLWSERFDTENKDIFAIQDAITLRVAGTLISNLTRIEQERSLAKPTENLGAYDHVLRGRAELRSATRRTNRRAIQTFERAIELDPDYAAAYAWLGRAHYQAASNGWTEFPEQSLERAEFFAQQASNLDPRAVEALRTLARIHSLKFQIKRALAEIDQAISINPSDAEALGDRGTILVWSGRLEEAIEVYKPAFVFDPNLRGEHVFSHGLAYYLLRRHEDAIRVLERGVARYPDYIFIRVVLVAAYGQLGQIVEARRNAEEVRRIFPIFDPGTFGARLRDPALQEYLAEGLKKGGLL
jgi:adenylate cyclase